MRNNTKEERRVRIDGSVLVAYLFLGRPSRHHVLHICQKFVDDLRYQTGLELNPLEVREFIWRRAQPSEELRKILRQARREEEKRRATKKKK